MTDRTRLTAKAFRNAFEETHGGDESQRAEAKHFAEALLQRDDAKEHDLDDAVVVVAKW